MRHRFSSVIILSFFSILLFGHALFAGTPVWSEASVSPAVRDIRLMGAPVGFSAPATCPDGHRLSHRWRIVTDPTARAYFTAGSTSASTQVAFPWVTPTYNPIGSSILIEVTVNHADPVTDGDMSVSRLFQARIAGVNLPPVPVIFANPVSSPENRIPGGSGVLLSSDGSYDPDGGGVRHEWQVYILSGGYSKPFVVYGTEGTLCAFTVPPLLTPTSEVGVTLVLLDGLHRITKPITVYLKQAYTAPKPTRPPSRTRYRIENSRRLVDGPAR